MVIIILHCLLDVYNVYCYQGSFFRLSDLNVFRPERLIGFLFIIYWFYQFEFIDLSTYNFLIQFRKFLIVTNYFIPLLLQPAPFSYNIKMAVLKLLSYTLVISKWLFLVCNWYFVNFVISYNFNLFNSKVIFQLKSWF